MFAVTFRKRAESANRNHFSLRIGNIPMFENQYTLSILDLDDQEHLYALKKPLLIIAYVSGSEG